MKNDTPIPRPLVRTNQWFIVLFVLAAWLTHAGWLLAVPLVAGVMGLTLNWNPVMWFAKLFLRRPASAYILEDRAQQQFNQVIAVTCLTLALIAFATGFAIVGYIFSTLVAAAAFIAILGFCVGCLIRFQWTQYRHRRSMRHPV